MVIRNDVNHATYTVVHVYYHLYILLQHTTATRHCNTLLQHTTATRHTTYIKQSTQWYMRITTYTLYCNTLLQHATATRYCNTTHDVYHAAVQPIVFGESFLQSQVSISYFISPISSLNLSFSAKEPCNLWLFCGK